MPRKRRAAKAPKGELPLPFIFQGEALAHFNDLLRPLMDAGWRVELLETSNEVGEPFRVYLNLCINNVDEFAKWVC